MATNNAHSSVKLVQKPARANRVIISGRRLALYDDLYHFILTRSWSAYTGLFVLVFVLLNAIFALLYRVSPSCIAGVDSYEGAFFFSVQTLGTIGYGSMAPQTRYGHIMVTLEALVGMFTVAMVTGLTFAKFARITAKVIFTERAVIAPRNGVPHLMFRLANWRNNQVTEAYLRVALMVTEETAEGERMRRFIDLPLVRERSSAFVLTWTALHVIDEASPFFGPGALEKLRAREGELYLSMTGVDETSGSTIHARYQYGLDEVAVGMRFADVIEVLPDGTRHLNYEHFHALVPIDAKPLPPGDVDDERAVV